MAGAHIGTGATLTLGTYTYSVDITNVSQGAETIPVIDTTHLGTTGSRTKIVGKIIDHGSVDFDSHVDSALLDSMKTALAGGSQTCTITFPVKTGNTTGATASGSGALTSHNYTIPLEDKMVANFTLTWLGAVTYTDGA